MSSQTEQELCCSVCHDIFRDPVILSCCHSFCKDCLQMWWKEKTTHTCPLCMKIPSSSNPPVSLVLKNLCEAMLEEKAARGGAPETAAAAEAPETAAAAACEALCSLHSEKLKLFCLNHEEPACLVCRDSKAHNNHRFRPIEEAAQDLKEKLQISLQCLQEKLKLFESMKANSELTVEHNRMQVQYTENQITEQFKKLHHFLFEEEEARITALKTEEEQKTQMMKKKIEALSRKIAALSQTIRATQEELRAEDSLFLHNYKAAAERTRQQPLLEDPEVVSGALIDVAKHLGNLAYNIWNKMKEMVSYSPVILDPNTAEAHLFISEDLTSVRQGSKQKLPENPERFDSYSVVLGSEGFDSGIHSWDVEVSSDGVWSLGVLQESLKRKGQSETGFWEICLQDGTYTAASPPLPSKVLQVQTLQKVQVLLHCKKGKISFFDLDTNTLIHTFKFSVTEKLFPYFETKTKPLMILPSTISVNADRQLLRSKKFAPSFSLHKHV
ncbi:tripartite motif-containing protein 35-like [Archocentrus centrarchus]|uniref:tripartite motif-containing protein 35-like n=1 Tax=Archocentrus centrarchus TaxID=63155 RepID=UPI0011E9F9E6|nr:tripartite motif-containing protein 35-like [Archocentrus centrarchus]